MTNTEIEVLHVPGAARLFQTPFDTVCQSMLGLTAAIAGKERALACEFCPALPGRCCVCGAGR